ncbi:MAG: class I SAM-dependent methyltransferase [Actinomycetota bacterium]|nr:class I SAM-dependent methyltransferase [Actinomycetota bacterium]
MGASKDEREARRHFAERYSPEPDEILDAVERAVLGDAWGGNGFTTVAEANTLGERAGLNENSHLLDIGSGRGWPGLYLARRTGCRATLSDLPVEGLRLAINRAARERLELTGAVVASAKDLPFTSRSFDAVIHTDVLC